MAEVGIAVAILAGIGSFVAPCILPMIPAFLAYISGTTISEMSQNKSKTLVVSRANIVLNAVFFVLGFSVVFSMLGVVINGLFTSSAGDLITGFNQVGGVIIAGFGVFLILSTRIARLNVEKRFFPKMGKARYPMSFVFGLAFAAGWTPCVGPVLGTILTLAATTPSIAFNLLLAYSLGLGIPFILMAVFFSRASRLIRQISKHLRYYSVILGAFIVVLGVLVFFNQLAYIANFPLLNELLLLG